MMGTDDSFIGPVNLGNPVEFSVRDLAKKVIELTGSKSRLQFLPIPLDDPQKRRPDISIAQKELNWRPKIDLETGLIKTIEYFKNVLKL